MKYDATKGWSGVRIVKVCSCQLKETFVKKNKHQRTAHTLVTKSNDVHRKDQKKSTTTYYSMIIYLWQRAQRMFLDFSSADGSDGFQAQATLE